MEKDAIMKVEINNKALLAIGLLSASLAFGDFVSVIDSKSAGGISVIEDNGGKTTLYNGGLVTGNGSVPLSEDMSKFDSVLIYAKYFNAGTDWRTHVALYEPEELLNTDTETKYIMWDTAAGTDMSGARVGIFSNGTTNTSLKVYTQTTTYSQGGVYKVVGINY
jgi:hypothetical protein